MKQTPICFSGEYFGVILSFAMSGHTDYEKKKKKKKSLSDLESILSEFYVKLFSTFAKTSNCYLKQ